MSIDFAMEINRRVIQDYRNDIFKIQLATDPRMVAQLAQAVHGEAWARAIDPGQISSARAARTRAAIEKLKALYEKNPSNEKAYQFWQLCRGWAPELARYFSVICKSVEA